MQVTDETTHSTRSRIQELCRQLAHLISLSREQRQAIDRLVAELNVVSRHIERRSRGAAPTEDREVAKAASARSRSR